jgi:hypothetical protein
MACGCAVFLALSARRSTSIHDPRVQGGGLLAPAATLLDNSRRAGFIPWHITRSQTQFLLAL